MKHEEIYDKHTDTRKAAKSPGKKKFKEAIDKDARRRRVSFKNYVRELEEDFLGDDLDDLDDETYITDMR